MISEVNIETLIDCIKNKVESCEISYMEGNKLHTFKLTDKLLTETIDIVIDPLKEPITHVVFIFIGNKILLNKDYDYFEKYLKKELKNYKIEIVSEAYILEKMPNVFLS